MEQKNLLQNNVHNRCLEIAIWSQTRTNSCRRRWRRTSMQIREYLYFESRKWKKDSERWERGKKEKAWVNSETGIAQWRSPNPRASHENISDRLREERLKADTDIAASLGQNPRFYQRWGKNQKEEIPSLPIVLLLGHNHQINVSDTWYLKINIKFDSSWPILRSDYCLCGSLSCSWISFELLGHLSVCRSPPSSWDSTAFLGLHNILRSPLSSWVSPAFTGSPQPLLGLLHELEFPQHSWVSSAFLSLLIQTFPTANQRISELTICKSRRIQDSGVCNAAMWCMKC